MKAHHLLSVVPYLPQAIVKSSRMNLGGNIYGEESLRGQHLKCLRGRQGGGQWSRVAVVENDSGNEGLRVIDQ